ncbi:MAG TPA: hypothetical protein VJ672_09065 [Gemmatimonadaceae bacterium]|nr:hypothetical protein [Gemmatimonadaceae bacterium]
MTEGGTERVVVFVDSRRVEVARDATVLEAVRVADAAIADAVSAGDRVVTDSRGLPISADAGVHGGAIFRVIAARRRGSSDASLDR